jgi:hypothetical protein
MGGDDEYSLRALARLSPTEHESLEMAACTVSNDGGSYLQSACSGSRITGLENNAIVSAVLACAGSPALPGQVGVFPHERGGGPEALG